MLVPNILWPQVISSTFCNHFVIVSFSSPVTRRERQNPSWDQNRRRNSRKKSKSRSGRNDFLKIMNMLTLKLLFLRESDFFSKANDCRLRRNHTWQLKDLNVFLKKKITIIQRQPWSNIAGRDFFYCCQLSICMTLKGTAEQQTGLLPGILTLYCLALQNLFCAPKRPINIFSSSLRFVVFLLVILEGGLGSGLCVLFLIESWYF